MSKQPNDNNRNGKRLFSFAMVLFVLALGIGIGTLICSRVGATGPGDSQLQMQSDGKLVAEGPVLALSKAFEEAATRVEPCVVNINTQEVVSNRRPNQQGDDSEDPMGELYRRFFGRPFQQEPEEQLRRSLGSGVIVDPKGYIITNNHVVEDATKIKVSLASGAEYTAKVIGTDPISDIAVIKITGTKEFPYARIGNSKSTKVGDWVIAIGSPFGLDQSVTAGIISATGRTFADGSGPSAGSQFNDYLQTDASINPGNSGGPLVNMNAEVIGINSFISTPSRASAGVGFAVPSHLFVRVYNQILQTGKVSRGWVGVGMNGQPLTPAMAKFFGVKQGYGVLITQLSDEKGKAANTGPAAKAGIKPEDVVIEFDGKKIANNQDFRMAVADTPPGKKVVIKVVRQGKEMPLDVIVAERKLEEQEKAQYSFEEKEEKPKTEIGLSFDTIPSGLAESMNISGGAYIVSVKPGSLADDAGLVGADEGGRGDVVVAANGKPVNNPQDLLGIVKNLKSGEAVVLKFLRIAGQDENRNIVSVPNYTSIIKP
ncbi:MAG TPA: trypsin-like peptidase domain-containing protein [Acidobacteriota bacterium]|nr:trypsin-like peptidase domain-containing protein [Acidobacteriota bacterium]